MNIKRSLLSTSLHTTVVVDSLATVVSSGSHVHYGISMSATSLVLNNLCKLQNTLHTNAMWLSVSLTHTHARAYNNQYNGFAPTSSLK